MLIDDIDNLSVHIRCKACGVTYFDLDDDPHIACNCEFFEEYERDRLGVTDDDEELELGNDE